MEAEQQQLVRDLMMAIAENKPRDMLLDLARKAKISLSAVWSEYQQAINVVDVMVSTYIREPKWVMGWWSPEVTAKESAPPTPAPTILRLPDKSERVLAIAEDLRAGGASRITVKSIIERLRAQGDQRPDKKMAISIGNILTWSGKWTKVSSGEYEPLEVKEG